MFQAILFGLAAIGCQDDRDWQAEVEELDAYVAASRDAWHVPGMAIAVVKHDSAAHGAADPLHGNAPESSGH